MRYPELPLLPNHVRIVGNIERLAGRWEGRGALGERMGGQLRKRATPHAIASALRLEGIGVTDDEVISQLRGLNEGSAGIAAQQSPRRAQINGMLALRDQVASPGGRIQLSSSNLFWLHELLMGGNAASADQVGQFRAGDLVVQAYDQNGSPVSEVFRAAVDPSQIPAFTETILSGVEDELARGETHPLLITSWFVAEFLCLQPFANGNLRLALSLAENILVKSGFPQFAAVPLARAIEKEVGPFYVALRKVRRSLNTDCSGFIDWHSLFLGLLQSEGRKVVDRLRLDDLIRHLPPLSEDIVQIVRQHGRITVRDAHAATGANRNTVKAHLRKLVEGGILDRMGTGKGSWYRLPS